MSLKTREEFIAQLKAVWSENKSKHTDIGQQELEQAMKRMTELDNLIQNLYESSVKGTLPERQAQRIARYEAHLAKRRDEYHQRKQKGGYSGMNELNPNLNKANKEVTMELNFIKSGDYYIPDIKLKNPNIRLGKWGRMRREYLRQAHPIVF